VFRKEVGRQSKIVGLCPLFVEPWSVRIANTSSDAQPTTNTAIVCLICNPPYDRDRKRVAIPKYNFPHHLATVHKGYYAIPGWPAHHSKDGKERHPARPTRRGLHIGDELAAALAFGEGEEARLQVALSLTWTQLGATVPADVPDILLSDDDDEHVFLLDNNALSKDTSASITAGLRVSGTQHDTQPDLTLPLAAAMAVTADAVAALSPSLVAPITNLVPPKPSGTDTSISGQSSGVQSITRSRHKRKSSAGVSGDNLGPAVAESSLAAVTAKGAPRTRRKRTRSGSVTVQSVPALPSSHELSQDIPRSDAGPSGSSAPRGRGRGRGGRGRGRGRGSDNAA
jgi:hypothetical protein